MNNKFNTKSNGDGLIDLMAILILLRLFHKCASFKRVLSTFTICFKLDVTIAQKSSMSTKCITNVNVIRVFSASEFMTADFAKKSFLSRTRDRIKFRVLKLLQYFREHLGSNNIRKKLILQWQYIYINRTEI